MDGGAYAIAGPPGRTGYVPPFVSISTKSFFQNDELRCSKQEYEPRPQNWHFIAAATSYFFLGDMSDAYIYAIILSALVTLDKYSCGLPYT